MSAVRRRGDALQLLNGRFSAVAQLRPNGAHLLEVEGAIGAATFTRDMIPRLKEAIKDFETELAFEDRRSGDRTHPHRLELAGRG